LRRQGIQVFELLKHLQTGENNLKLTKRIKRVLKKSKIIRAAYSGYKKQRKKFENF